MVTIIKNVKEVKDTLLRCFYCSVTGCTQQDRRACFMKAIIGDK